ncbi:hypothetical protein SAMN05216389_10186 [Oceanobacillus limi]|uniref:Uncharacterized protein n=1 Tax=Oceanobacillus limi TaxID=930131 RepID=A0A1H9Y0H7_9BACI|nr:hypothetical protein SAMN05216389_10186 [Oceanobacillus limi]
MTNKLKFFNEKDIATKIHEYLIQLPNVEFDDEAKGPTIGYKVKNQNYKFATLHGGNSYQSLVLHVLPGNPHTLVGKELQKEVQNKFNFDIRKIRSHVLKGHEIFIPLELLNNKNPYNGIKHIIFYALYVQE